jgi:hypothetical protein
MKIIMLIRYAIPVFTLIVLLNLSCGRKREKHNGVNELRHRSSRDSNTGCKFTIEDLKKKLLKAPLSQLTDLNGCFIIKDTVMYGDDDDTFWKAVAYFKNKKLSFIAEANLVDKTHVRRITIEDSTIRSKNGLAVGSILKNIKPFINQNPDSNPDGYLSFSDKNDNSINYYMDVSQYPSIAEGRVTNLDRMPTDLKIKEILINSN